MLNGKNHNDFDNNLLEQKRKLWPMIFVLMLGLGVLLISFHYYVKIYEPYRERINRLSHKSIEKKNVDDPALIKSYINGRNWMVDSYATMKEKLHRKKVFMDYYMYRKNTLKKKNLAFNPDKNQIINLANVQGEDSFEIMEEDEYTKGHVSKNYGNIENLPVIPQSKGISYKNLPAIKGGSTNFLMEINGESFYIKGVAYNTAQDWRNGKVALTKNQLQNDFKAIRQMGANTITRKAGGNYDDIILKIAEEEGLYVILEFDLDPFIDYTNEKEELEAILKEIEDHVRRQRYKKALLGYTIGNKAWSAMSRNHREPYLFKVRMEYVKFLNKAATLIKELDVTHPVMTVVDFSKELPNEVVSLKMMSPEIDVICISTFYEEELSQVHKIFSSIYPERPYMVYEFGPRGYWDTELSNIVESIHVEDGSFEKAVRYQTLWNDYILKNRGSNIGGVAFAWRDRLEGSLTWFGITDVYGRKKPSYYALKNAYQEVIEAFPLPEVHIFTKQLSEENTFTFEFIIESDLQFNKEKHEINWELYRYDFMKQVGEISSTDNGKSAKVKIPYNPGEYRLYVYVSDKKGNVVTASKPILIKRGKMLSGPA
jgi:cellulose synthase (UDP-forming)